MKKVLVVTTHRAHNPQNMTWYGIRDALRDRLRDRLEIDMAALTELVFDISTNKMSVLYGSELIDAASYDAVVIRKCGNYKELAIALTHYLRAIKIPCSDSYLDAPGIGKLSSTTLFVRNGLLVPRTIYAKPTKLLSYIQNNGIEFPLVIKADIGKKGRDNHLATNLKDMSEILSNSDKPMIVQQFIENDGDYRALVLGEKIRLLLYRQAPQGSHLNNTSQGGSAKSENIGVLSSKLRTDIIRAANLLKTEVAGVDVIVDRNTGNPYFLEVNQAPEIGTGVLIEEKVDAYAEWIAEFAQGGDS